MPMLGFIRSRTILICLVLYGPGILSAHDTIPQADTSNLITFTIFPDVDPFHSDTPMNISLEFDMKAFIRGKYVEEYHDALLRFTDSRGSTVERNIRIRSRGDYRKKHCSFPPIKLNFKKSGVKDPSMNDLKSLKLVTHCKGGETYQQYILKEFLVYRMFNLLTEYSYRVRLFEIEYIDLQGKKKPFRKYGFIIESNDHLANRINALLLDREGIATWLTEPYQTTLMGLFQFMIGNTDWAIANLHNIRLFKLLDHHVPEPLAIPYDFDYSGMVNTYYALPDENLDIKSVRERVYRGYCLDSEDDYAPYFQVFLDHKSEIYSLVENFELLDIKHKREMIRYLDEFFEIIEDPFRARFNIISNCRPIPVR
jgi:hypothetical protein